MLTTQGSTFDTLLAVYSGSAFPLTLVTSDDNDPDSTVKDDYGGKTSALSFSAVAGTDYRIAVDGLNGAAGRLVLAGGYQHSINTPSGAATDPVSVGKVNLSGHLRRHDGAVATPRISHDDDAAGPWRPRWRLQFRKRAKLF